MKGCSLVVNLGHTAPIALRCSGNSSAGRHRTGAFKCRLPGSGVIPERAWWAGRIVLAVTISTAENGGRTAPTFFAASESHGFRVDPTGHGTAAGGSGRRRGRGGTPGKSRNRLAP